MKKHALLIGINDYSNLARLSFAAQDAEEVGRTLRETFGFCDDDELALLTCRRKGHFSPGRNNIRNHLKRLREMKGLDLLMVGFWGHGSVLASPSGSHERFLCAHDTFEDDLEDTGVSLNFLLDCLKRAGAADTCLILDCCQNLTGDRHADAGLSREDCDTLSRGARDILAARPNMDQDRNATTAILSSCSFQQRAHEWHEREHGIFTAHFLDAMRESDRLTDWAAHVSKEVPRTAAQYGKTQKPFLTIKGSGDIRFPSDAKPSPTKRKTKATPKTQVTPAAQSLVQTSSVKERPQVGERMVLTIQGAEYPFRWCPPGKFMMGSPGCEPWRHADEILHKVTLTKGFWMLETPVTQAMWQCVTGSNPSYFQGPRLPVEQVSWEDCQDYLKIMRVQTGNVPPGYRIALPTEAEWEYACRAGTTTPFYFGQNLTKHIANFAVGISFFWAGRTTEVGSYSPNAWGLYDMHGNVQEWCCDRHGDYPKGAATDPRGASSGPDRVLRGGSWFCSARCCRSAYRNNQTSHRRFDYGLRLALVREPE